MLDHYTVIVGAIDLNHLSDLSKEVKIKEIYVHENYQIPPSYDCDIALLQLDKYLSYSRYISPVLLAENLPPLDTKCVIAGWGETKVG